MDPAGPFPIRPGGAEREEQFAREVRDALAHLYDSIALETHALARFLPADDDSRVSAGNRLRENLEATIDALRPGQHATGASPASRVHTLLAMRYLEGLEARDIQRTLGLSPRQYFRDHRRGVDAVIALVRQRWGVSAGAPGAKPAAQAEPRAESSEPMWSLPVPLTSFVGRELELAEIAHLLDRGRLVTLTGPPGVGKTRLAIEAAARAQAAFRGRVRFCTLASVEDADLVAATLLQALGGRQEGGRSVLTDLVELLADADTLLVMDNFEQVVAAAPMVAHLLQACPRAKALVTSRLPLRVRGEQEFPLLPLPVDASRPTQRGAATSPAIELFADRARAVKPDFALTDDNAPQVARICARLDGLPLAIELAAAWAKLLTPEEIGTRLERPLDFLADGARDLPARQRTLRAAIAWSYLQLADAERVAFRRLAVFAGGCNLEAAQEVCGGEAGVDVERARAISAPVLVTLATLVDSSLLARQEHRPSELRFAMLETVREYAIECLEASGEAERLRDLHADYFLSLAEAAELQVEEPQLAWLERLDPESDNMRAAVKWLLGRGSAQRSLRLVGALTPYWNMRGRYAEGRHYLTRALALEVAPEPTQARARALVGLGIMARWQGDDSVADLAGQQALGLYEQLGDRRSIAHVLDQMGRLAVRSGSHEQARRLYERGLAIAREVHDDGQAAVLLFLLAEVAKLQGDLERARALWEESAPLLRQLGLTRSYASNLCFLGDLARRRGEHAKARSLLVQAAEVANVLGAPLAIAHALESFAALASAENKPHRALRLAAAAARLRESAGTVMPPHWKRDFVAALEPARQAFNEAEYAEALRAGSTLTAREAVDYALGGDD